MSPATTGRARGRIGDRGFTIVEILIIMVVIALISVIVIPIVMTTIQSSKQKRTMNDINQVGTAMMSWVSDQAGAAAAGAGTDVPMSDYGSPLPQETIEEMLVPQYLPTVPKFDAWGGDIEYRLNFANLSADRLMAIRSAGSDRVFSTDTYTQGPFDSRVYTEDLVWVDGLFVRWPQKQQ